MDRNATTWTDRINAIGFVRRGSLALLGCAFLVACAASDTPQDAATPVANGTVSTVEAVRLFDRICLATAPDFVSAGTRMASEDLTDIRSNGAAYDPTGTVSAKVQTRAEAGGITIERCSVVFQDTDNATGRTALMKTINTFGYATGPVREGVIGSRVVQIWDVRIDGREGRVIFAPTRSERLLGGIYLDIPSRNASA